ncbi:hypothetical protein BC829DRAFT_386437 [Chytridium lagenaria]|nr:hypothetical protein BC829DRAFT_386437 [Chytridium lagenaria]
MKSVILCQALLASFVLAGGSSVVAYLSVQTISTTLSSSELLIGSFGALYSSTNGGSPQSLLRSTDGGASFTALNLMAPGGYPLSSTAGKMFAVIGDQVIERRSRLFMLFLSIIKSVSSDTFYRSSGALKTVSTQVTTTVHHGHPSTAKVSSRSPTPQTLPSMNANTSLSVPWPSPPTPNKSLPSSPSSVSPGFTLSPSPSPRSTTFTPQHGTSISLNHFAPVMLTLSLVKDPSALILALSPSSTEESTLDPPETSSHSPLPPRAPSLKPPPSSPLPPLKPRWSDLKFLPMVKSLPRLGRGVFTRLLLETLVHGSSLIRRLAQNLASSTGTPQCPRDTLHVVSLPLVDLLLLTRHPLLLAPTLVRTFGPSSTKNTK